MAGPTPIVRQVVLCDRVSYDFSAGHVLTRPRIDFAVEPGEQFPLAIPELWLFIQVTGSYGRQTFRTRLVDVTDPTVAPLMLYESAEKAIDLGNPSGSFRLRARSWSTKLSNLYFPTAGRYELWIMFDGLPKGKVDLLVEAAP